jgi:hypothetical protein
VADARIIAACDAVVAALQTAWAPVAPDGIARLYVAPVTVQELPSLVGRQVWVFPASYDDDEETRGEDEWAHELGVLIVERCPDAGGPSVAWMDERVAFVEQTVRGTLKAFQGRGSLLADTYWLEKAPVVEVYQVQALNEAGIFWSEIEVTLREIVEA